MRRPVVLELKALGVMVMKKSWWRNSKQKGALSLGNRWSGLGGSADIGHDGSRVPGTRAW